jgi:hypothetical protein
MEVYGIKEEELGNYKIIQIVRNPYDRFVSAWKHQMEITLRFMGSSQNEKDISLSDMIDKVNLHKHLLPNNIDEFYKEFYGNISFKENSFKNGTWGGMRFWCDQTWWNTTTDTTVYFKLENLKNDISELSECVGINLPKLPHIKPNLYSKRNTDYRTYYTNDTMQSVKTLFNNDINILGYEF